MFGVNLFILDIFINIYLVLNFLDGGGLTINFLFVIDVLLVLLFVFSIISIEEFKSSSFSISDKLSIVILHCFDFLSLSGVSKHIIGVEKFESIDIGLTSLFLGVTYLSLCIDNGVVSRGVFFSVGV